MMPKSPLRTSTVAAVIFLEAATCVAADGATGIAWREPIDVAAGRGGAVNDGKTSPAMRYGPAAPFSAATAARETNGLNRSIGSGRIVCPLPELEIS